MLGHWSFFCTIVEDYFFAISLHFRLNSLLQKWCLHHRLFLHQKGLYGLGLDSCQMISFYESTL